MAVVCFYSDKMMVWQSRDWEALIGEHLVDKENGLMGRILGTIEKNKVDSVCVRHLWYFSLF